MTITLMFGQKQTKNTIKRSGNVTTHPDGLRTVDVVGAINRQAKDGRFVELKKVHVKPAKPEAG